MAGSIIKFSLHGRPWPVLVHIFERLELARAQLLKDQVWAKKLRLIPPVVSQGSGRMV